ncbi:MAG TPA: SDR family NAD(P)-dependent oxidoreductase, partial [Longimicrobiales bacterium]|nr:SDR family NAD(P)-dependent oxidoreductase [Longimicrobiales bacterium]
MTKRATFRRAILPVAATLASLPAQGRLAAQVPASDIEGREIVLVTGSTSGLGRELALRLGESGAHVIVHGRNEERGQEVVSEIEGRGGTARFIRADLASLDEVRQLAATVKRDYDRLDLLVNNAGIGRGPEGATREESADGYELRFAVNYLSHFLLTQELLPLLEAAAPSRIVNVTSVAQEAIDFDDVMLERAEYQGARAYAQSKLAQIMFTFTMAERLEGTGVTINAVHPAIYMDTPMVRNRGGTPMTTVDEGADPVMHVITAPDAGTGLYYRQDTPARAHEQAYDEE